MTTYREAVEQLSVAQKPGRGAPPYSRWINRRLGRWIAAGAYLAGRTPNQVTVASGCLSLIAIVLLGVLEPRWWTGLLIAALLVAGYAFDAADGQLARLRGGGSAAGEWLDHVVDATKICLLHSAVAISFFRFTDLPHGMLLVPLGYEAVSSVFFFTFILMEKLRKAEGRAAHRGDDAGRGLVQTALAAPTDYGLLCLVFVFLGWTPLFAILYTAMFAMHTVVLLVAMGRWWRELTSAGRTS